ncbi:MAG: enoyl-[acyl-carrier protein] reductase [Actinomycetota bacterium]|jgi:enoyl-[acyl-carrier protein] reductase III|nr:enoyl-[acyl-carrier protein] reductase [Actinomycetota bacterium]
MTADAEVDLKLDGRVALVTGGTRGLGKAIARRLCASGCTVVLNYAHSTSDADAAVASMVALRGQVLASRADISQSEEVLRLLGGIGEGYGKLDIFIHNAAIWHPMSAVHSAIEEFRAVHELTLNPLLYGAPRLAELMVDGGTIIAISSNGARETIPDYMGLGVAKAALESFVRYLAVEMAPAGISVNAVATAMLDKDEATQSAPPLSPIAQVLAARTPAGRLTRPADVANVVALLCTREAAWLQGQVLMVDGGLSLRA